MVPVVIGSAEQYDEGDSSGVARLSAEDNFPKGSIALFDTRSVKLHFAKGVLVNEV